jgi:2-keto-4-pentenoate hydratase/2-oxohepta-3-ene-1,7-dioic acid hydratase in catechol pathway
MCVILVEYDHGRNQQEVLRMMYARFEHGRDTAYGIVEGDRVRRLSGDLFGAWDKTEITHPLAEVALLVPATPSKVFAVGLNYRSHLGGRPMPEEPAIFLKPPSCLIPSGAEIVIPAGRGDVHFEGEMVVVIGKRARNVSAAEAHGYVLGVTCGNDVSARDWQKHDLQWWRAKGADTFGPCGPLIASGLNYDDLHLRLRVNGTVMQEQRTSDLIHSVGATLSFISRYVTLEPGDLIYTGTPGNTSALKPGDVVDVELEGVGLLTNRVVATA